MIGQDQKKNLTSNEMHLFFPHILYHVNLHIHDQIIKIAKESGNKDALKILKKII
jgi:hypothetical protein